MVRFYACQDNEVRCTIRTTQQIRMDTVEWIMSCTGWSTNKAVAWLRDRLEQGGRDWADWNALKFKKGAPYTDDGLGYCHCDDISGCEADGWQIYRGEM